MYNNIIRYLPSLLSVTLNLVSQKPLAESLQVHLTIMYESVTVLLKNDTPLLPGSALLSTQGGD